MLSRVARVLRQPIFVAGILFAAILTGPGAFGTFRIVLPLRLLYWIVVTFSAAACLVAASSFHHGLIKRPSSQSVVTILVAAVPTALVAGAAAALLIPEPMSLRRLIGFYPSALFINALLLALLRLTAKRDVIVEVAPPARPDDIVPHAIASKLPPRLARSRLLLVEAQDHYLRIATRDGQALIHMRFADALAALGKSDGERVHRSWWVARTAIDGVRFFSGRGELTLRDGTVVPVSRRFAPQARELARRPKP